MFYEDLWPPIDPSFAKVLAAGPRSCQLAAEGVGGKLKLSFNGRRKPRHRELRHSMGGI